MHRILLLMPGNTYRAKAFIDAAKKLKIDLIIGSDQEQTLTSLLPNRYLTLNFQKIKLSTEKIVKLNAKIKIDKIIAVDDQGLLLASAASQKLDLQSNSYFSMNLTRNKYLLYKQLQKNQQTIYDFVLHSKKKKLNSLKIKFPVVIKPLGLSASRGVMRANNKEELAEKIHLLFDLLENELANECISEFEKEHILIQKYIPGKEYAVEGIIEKGRFKLIAIFEKPIPLTGPYFEETIYISDPNFDEEIRRNFQGISQEHIKNIGITEGAVHLEYRLNKKGMHLIDIAGRSIGGHCSQVLQFKNGALLEEIILNNAIGKKNVAQIKNISGVMMIPTIKEGKISHIAGLESAKKIKFITNIVITAYKGQEIKKLPRANTYLGFIFAEGPNKHAVKKALEQSYQSIQIDLF